MATMSGETPPADDASLDAAVVAVRRFSRFYTRRIGVLQEGLLGGPLSLTEGRIVWELAQTPGHTAARLAETLALDPGYVSRLLRGLEERRLIARSASPRDARETLLSLTRAGRSAFNAINARSQQEVGAMLANLPRSERARLVAAIGTVEHLLGDCVEPRVPYILRPPRIGDLGFVVHRQAALYSQEYGWNGEFEALVADIVGKYLRNFRPDCERCWIAELDGERVGAVFVVHKSATVAQLRLLILAQAARGLGLGGRLVDECIAFARAKGYKKMRLWTNSCLDAARAIYAKRGLRLVKSEPYHGFGHDLVGETWELKL